jgi:desulfoferrodoxin-like iron-binding protein
MGVERTGEVYVCNVCGNKVKVVEVGGGTLVCCGQNMSKIEG